MVEESKVIRAVAAIVTLVAFLATVTFAVIGFVTTQYGLGIISILISALLAAFVWNDYNKYIRKE